jgi:hypothetical protein
MAKPSPVTPELTPCEREPQERDRAVVRHREETRAPISTEHGRVYADVPHWGAQMGAWRIGLRDS